MTIWITGVSGYIGSTLAHMLNEQGQNWVGLDRMPPRFVVGDNNQFLVGSVNPEALTALGDLAGQPSRVYHLAGGSSVGPSFDDPKADFDATVGSSVALLDHLRRNAPTAVAVFASSAAVYGNDHHGPISETDAARPFSPYGVHKHLMELSAYSFNRFFSVDARVARLFSVYGAGLNKQILWDLCHKFASGKPAELGGTGEERRDFIHGSDVAAGLIAIGDLKTADVESPVNLGSGTATRIATVVSLAANAWHVETGHLPSFSFGGRVRAGDPLSLVASVDRATKHGFSPVVSLESGISEYVRWFLSLNKSS